MSGPVHMNQVIYQTPNVGKAQQAENQNPDQTQRHASVQEQVLLREKTETVQTPVEPEASRFVENEEKKREEARKKKRRLEAKDEEASEESAEKSEQAGNIVDVVI